MGRISLLRRHPLFQDVPQAALQEAAQIMVERRFPAGGVLLSQDAQGEAMYLLTGGAVRVSRVSLGGHERVMGDLYAPDVIGETAVLDGGERSATVVALNEVSALMLYRDHFRQLLRRHPELLWNLGRVLAQRVTFLNDELIAFGLNTEAALSHVLTQSYRQRVRAGIPQPEVLPLGPQDIMQRISSSRETVARVLRKLQRDGLVRVQDQHVVLLAVDRLEAVTLHAPDVE